MTETDTFIRSALPVRKTLGWFFICASFFILPHRSRSDQPPALSIRDCHVEFLAIAHPGSARIIGKSEGSNTIVATAEKKNQQTTFRFQFDLDALDTGIKLRSEHMKQNYLEIHKYPKAFFEMNIPVSLLIADGVEKAFQGKLTLHSVQHLITGVFTLTGAGDQPTVASHFTLKLSDFNIPKPEFMGIVVNDEVKVDVTFSTSTLPFSIKK